MVRCGVFERSGVMFSHNESSCDTEKPAKSMENPSTQPECVSLVGRYDHRLDPKRRLTIPSSWFETLGSPKRMAVMRSRTGEPCLEVFTEAEQMARMKAFEEASRRDKAIKDFLRAVSENTEILTVDVQNRIRVSDLLLRHAKLGGEENQVVLIGMAGHFEVWSLAEKPPVSENAGAGYDEWVKKAMELGF